MIRTTSERRSRTGLAGASRRCSSFPPRRHRRKLLMQLTPSRRSPARLRTRQSSPIRAMQSSTLRRRQLRDQVGHGDTPHRGTRHIHPDLAHPPAGRLHPHRRRAGAGRSPPRVPLGRRDGGGEMRRGATEARRGKMVLGFYHPANRLFLIDVFYDDKIALCRRAEVSTRYQYSSSSPSQIHIASPLPPCLHRPASLGRRSVADPFIANAFRRSFHE